MYAYKLTYGAILVNGVDTGAASSNFQFFDCGTSEITSLTFNARILSADSVSGVQFFSTTADGSGRITAKPAVTVISTGYPTATR